MDFFSPLPPGRWAWPEKKTGIGWGFQRSKNHKHQGVDLAVPIGTPVFAIADGVVTQRNAALLSCTRHDGSRRSTGPGWYLTLRHADNLHSRYLHLSSRSVAIGDVVEGGDEIGESGASLLSCREMRTAPHLHFELWQGAPRAGEAPGGSTNNSIDPTGWARLHALAPGRPGKGGGGAILLLLALAVAGGGAYYVLR